MNITIPLPLPPGTGQKDSWPLEVQVEYYPNAQSGSKIGNLTSRVWVPATLKLEPNGSIMTGPTVLVIPPMCITHDGHVESILKLSAPLDSGAGGSRGPRTIESEDSGSSGLSAIATSQNANGTQHHAVHYYEIVPCEAKLTQVAQGRHEAGHVARTGVGDPELKMEPGAPYKVSHEAIMINFGKISLNSLAKE